MATSVRIVEGVAASLPPRVLLCHGDERTRRDVGAALVGAGVRVVACETAAEAERILRESGVDAALWSIAELPRAGGQAPAIGEGGDVPVVLLAAATDLAALERAQAAMERGAFDYLAVPCAPSELVDMVRRAASFRAGTLRERRAEGDAAAQRARLETRRAELEVLVARADAADEPDRKLVPLLIHDLKNQIAVIRSNLSYLLDEPSAGDPRHLLEDAAAAVDPVLTALVALGETSSPPSLGSRRRDPDL